MFDLIFSGADVIDGSGAKPQKVDVALQGDRIAAVGDLSAASATKRLDITGKILAPGFIDVHTHSDGWLRKFPNFIQKTSQGFTTEVLMADGISYAPLSAGTSAEWIFYLRTLNGLTADDFSGWRSLRDYMSAFDSRSAQNVATHIPYANVRSMFCGFGSAAPDAAQMKKIQAELVKGMEAGAVGVSTGLEYLGQTFCSNEELIAAMRSIAQYRPLYVTHIRYPLGLLAAVKEAVEIGKAAGVPLHISHLKTADEKLGAEVLRYIDTVAVNEVDFTFDVYPYAASSTMLNYLLPYGEWTEGAKALKEKLRDPKLVAGVRAELEKEDLSKAYVAWLPSEKNRPYIGRPLTEYFEAVKLSPAKAVLKLLDEEELSVLIVFRRGDDNAMLPFVQHRTSMLGSDGIYQPGGKVHPRMFGSPARMLGPLVRDKKLFSLEEAVRKMSGFSAKRFGLKERGIIAEGNVADLVVFDPQAIADRATYENPSESSVGIEAVFVNGREIVRDEKPVNGELPGRFLKYQI